MKLYKFITQVEIQEGEAFWGGAVAHGIHMPITRTSDYSFDSCGQGTTNPVNGLFCSTQGRYLLLRGDFRISAHGGVITLEADEKPAIGKAGETLKEAYLAAAKSFATDPVSVPRELLTHPQFCTWTEMLVDITQEKVEDYARSIVLSGMPYGVIILDDGWMNTYGEWDFVDAKFSDPKKMVDTLHRLGFKVQLWLVPFVDKSARDYDLLAGNNALVRSADGTIAEREWWNGKSAVLDMTSVFAHDWLKRQLDYLVMRYGVDGFKFDAGDCIYYRDDDLCARKTTASEQNYLWAEFAGQYRYSELRACFEYAGMHTIIRLCDKRRSWDRADGIGALVPNMINAGLCGYPYTCADMIGGGSIADFEGEGEGVDYELISRFCECAALMPCMQFSHAYWRTNPVIGEMFLKYAKLHVGLEKYLVSLILEAESTHAPILRALEYEFPRQGFAEDEGSFMLGSDYLVSPVTVKGQTEKTLKLPHGCDWVYAPTGVRYTGGEKVTVPAPVGTLPYFKRENSDAETFKNHLLSREIFRKIDEDLPGKEKNMKTTLVVMAAGMGSRFGGLKQAEPITEDGKTILDFSVYDAKKAGFSKVVFIIRKDMEADFKALVGDRIARTTEVEYVIQDSSVLPTGRTKPLGTGHAIYCCKDVVKEPFAIINADDYYGANAFYEIEKHLENAARGEYAMTAYRLGNTLSKNGTVSRGVCERRGDYLARVTEVTKIAPDGSCLWQGEEAVLPPETPVSMNLWGLTPDIFEVLEEEYAKFLATADLMKDEFFIPSVITKALESGRATVRVYENDDLWYGITYREDLTEVKEAIGGYINDGLYEGI